MLGQDSGEQKRLKVTFSRFNPLLLMPTGLADGFGSKEFAYSPDGEIHPGHLGPPPRSRGFGLYSVVLRAYRCPPAEINSLAQ
jgi:hypothetical protein